MELGNMLFGHSRGCCEVPRGAGYEELLERLFDAIAPRRDTSWRDYGVDFENGTFSCFPYYWGDCTCGYEGRWRIKEEAWEAENPHADNCYQTELRVRTERYDRESGYGDIYRAAFGGDHSLFSGYDNQIEPIVIGDTVVGQSWIGTPRKDEAMERWRAASDARQKFLEELYADLCQKFKRPEAGCAVHCTCGRDELWRTFAVTDSHEVRCPIVRPNFEYKPTQYELRWYKYPLRDSYASENLSVEGFGQMIDRCIASTQTVDAVDPSAGSTRKLSTRD